MKEEDFGTRHPKINSVVIHPVFQTLLAFSLGLIMLWFNCFSGYFYFLYSAGFASIITGFFYLRFAFDNINVKARFPGQGGQSPNHRPSSQSPRLRLKRGYHHVDHGLDQSFDASSFGKGSWFGFLGNRRECTLFLSN